MDPRVFRSGQPQRPCVLPPQESTVVPLLMQGLQSLCKERPDDPIDYLAHYLLQNNPRAGGEALVQQPPAAPSGAGSGGAEAG